MNNHHLVILCGGEGKRLWPLATPEYPKQFLPWTQTTTLFDETVQRIQPFLDRGAHLHVVTQKRYRHFFAAYEGIIETFFEEDVSRNTAPAILYALNGIINKKFDQCVTFLPADHYIADKDLFVESLEKFLLFLEKGNALCAMGVKPTRAATEYGYIEAERNFAHIKKVERFYEKPSKDRAEAFIENPAMLWNTGVYGGKVEIFLQEYQKYAPQLVHAMNLHEDNKISYHDLTHISFDFAIAEKTNKLMVFESKYEWSDVGSVDVFLKLVPNISMYQNKMNLMQAGEKNI